MAEMSNFSEINENFDTIKTLLNSIRAQGILNTSDVDKLLTGINSKLEKINTEEDIDLIKIFLSELKQNLDERHNILLSKFGAIESLFSNLLKNSAELPKSTQLKELFDIVATNLSVFSREVVSQKETLTDITLRLDAIRSDDSHKKDIIKNITLLKPDLERLNNGFDSIVISLNDNFKTIVKTISSIDKTEHLDNFASVLNNIEMSSNTLLSAIQVLDKKAEIVDESLRNLATKNDISLTNQKITELSVQNHDISNIVSDLSVKYSAIDSLADKIDASVNIVASLKTALEDADNSNTQSIIHQLKTLEAELASTSSYAKFEELKLSLEDVLRNIAESKSLAEKSLGVSVDEIQKISALIKSLDININFQNIYNLIEEKSQLAVESQESTLSKILREFETNAESLTTQLNQTQASVANLCEKKFGEIFLNVANLKNTISQLDDNSVSANNAIFSNITDRLTIFENSLSKSLEIQENTLSSSTAQLVESLENVKNLTNVLDYKMDSTVIEVNNVKQDFSTLRESVEGVLALDFVTVVKDLRVDLYASKQDMISALNSVSAVSSENIIKDFTAKFDLLSSTLESFEQQLKNNQAESIKTIKTNLENVSNTLTNLLNSIEDSNKKYGDLIDKRLVEVKDSLKEYTASCIENVNNAVEVVKMQIENNLGDIESHITESLDTVKRSISENSGDIKKELKYSYSKLLELQDFYNELKETLNVNNSSTTGKMDDVILATTDVKTELGSNLADLKQLILDKIGEFKQDFSVENIDKVSEIKFTVESLISKNTADLIDVVKNLKENVAKSSVDGANERAASLAKILDNFISVRELITTNSESSKSFIQDKVVEILQDFAVVKENLNRVDESIDEDLTHQLSIIESNFEALVSQMTILFDKSDKSLSDKINKEFLDVSNKIDLSISEKLENYRTIVEKTFNNLENRTLDQANFVQNKIADLNSSMKNSFATQVENNSKHLEEISEKLKGLLEGSIKESAENMASLKESLVTFAKNVDANNEVLAQDMKSRLDDIVKYIDSVLEIHSQNLEAKQDEFAALLENTSEILVINTTNSNNAMKSVVEDMAAKSDLNKAEILKSVSEVKDIAAEQISYAGAAKADLMAITQTTANTNTLLESLQDVMNKDFVDTKSSISQVAELTENINTAISENANTLTSTKNSISDISSAISSNKQILVELQQSLDEKSIAMQSLIAEISAGELQTLDVYVENITALVEEQKQLVQACNDAIVDFVKKELNLITQNVEKETDVVIGELIEQFDILKRNQADDVVNMTSRIEELVSGHIYDSIGDLKSYLDIKTDNSVAISKIDNLRVELTDSVENVLSDMNKLLDKEVFKTSMADFRAASEIFMNSAIERIHDKVNAFFAENSSTIVECLKVDSIKVEEKLELFDKKFITTVVDKYEEIKQISLKYNESFDSIQQSMLAVVDNFDVVEETIVTKIDNLAKLIEDTSASNNNEMFSLSQAFEDLRTQITNKSFDEAFQASIEKQLEGLQTLIDEQFGYLEDINDLCSNNLPDLTELNILVKHSIMNAISEFSSKLDSLNISEVIEEKFELVNNELNQVKSDVITQFLNIFNQISFIAEQEEILDFIQEKHDELITVLSHIVTTIEGVETVKENIVVVDNKIDSLRDDIELINEKITAIISAEGDIDYVYSLQDLETDIANLRVVLNEIKEKDHTEEFADLINSTNEVYALVESIKSELPSKNSFDSLTEDIVSISTRTNKLILASDESYKTLQDNLQDFKLVINDLDERTRNFAKESGMDRIDSKLNALNNMMISGAKTNQVFNQIFEYLAEWVDNASVQIETISDRVNTLDEIGQIKTMLADLKAESEDNSETVELVEALGSVFEKQTKKISSIETKLDKIIVETTVNNSKNTMDSMEETLNRFLVAMDEKLSSQQAKINSLEEKFENIMSLLDDKNTAQLTKKVGGMDRQIAKLNKSIEKIASHVVEK